MKVELTPIMTTKKTNFFTRVKRFFVGKLETLKEDRFEKKYCRLPKDEVITFRKDPNWCESADSTYKNPTIAKRTIYYPEDIEKMKSMTDKEVWEYKDYLDKTGRFYYGETLTKEEHEEFMRSLGLNPEKYYIKD